MFVPTALPPTGSLLGIYTAFSVCPGHSVDHPRSTASPPTVREETVISAYLSCTPSLRAQQSHSKTLNS